MKLSVLVAACLSGAIIPGTSHGTEPERDGANGWSLQPLRRPTLPAVKGPSSVDNPVDAFVLHRLEERGLKPAPPADRRTLIRRVTFDVTGLPPTPKEIDAFLTDDSPHAYGTVVDRLLASPHYGERWARHWLDAVRFSESHGFEYDRLRNHAWPYRDYVITALNDDRPYARFVREQLAGDVAEPVTREGVAATGLLTAGPYDQAGNNSASAVLRARVREDELEDMLSAVGQTFLGLTVNCARCHDHKFDPIPIKDYYRLKAVFDGAFHGDRPLISPEEQKAKERAVAALDAAIREAEPGIREIEKRGRESALARRAGVASAGTGELPAPLSRWTFATPGEPGVVLKGGARIERGRLILDGKGAYAVAEPVEKDLHAKTLEAWVRLGDLAQRGGGVVAVEADAGRVFDAIVYAERKPGRWMAGSEFFLRTRDLDVPAETAKPGTPVHVAITYAADGRISVYRNGEPYGESYTPTAQGGKQPTFPAKGSRVLFGLRHTGGSNPYLNGEIDEARLYDRALSAAEVRASFSAGTERISRSELLAALEPADARRLQALEMDLTCLKAERERAAAVRMAYAVNPRQPGPTHLLRRGDVEQKTDLVTAGPPSAVRGPPPEFGLPADAPEGQRRLRFAEWVAHADNPLTWRVMANRVWQHHFGEGIVRTPNDFGFNGERPTHPELLDWLAAELRDSGGSLKRLHRLILTSSTYRQSSRPDADAVAADADNRQLWRYPLRRLEAEAVRDAMLAVSGRLNPQAGGPSFRPFKVETFNSAFYHPFDADDPALDRRSVYRMNVNSARDPLLEALDCPDPTVKTPRRGVTTTPLQALILMNGPFVQRQARHFAERVQREGGETAAAQVALAYRLAFGRPATPAEVGQAVEVARKHGMKSVCWSLLNAAEFSYLR